ncbi:MAG: cytochrome C oxidase subunit IV [SAR202 cluster bacterium]|nr:cytochrome C oxidase subunit IV [SAR202 cluster bacterium]
MADTKKSHAGHNDAGAHADRSDFVAAGHTPHVEAHHPTAATYIKVAMTLVAITMVELLVFYVEGLGKGIIPVLLVLSSIKFALVIMFYMHLKYDTRLFSMLFLGGLALAISVYIALLALFYL